MRKSAKGRITKFVVAILALSGLSACAEIADVLLDDLSFCAGCDWIIQEWDNPGWSTHNSDPYKTEEICEQALAEQSRKNPERGYRCIYEGDLTPGKEEPPATPAAHCYRCDWVVERQRSAGWERVGSATYDGEGACQQALWRLRKENPYREYRCTSLGS